MAVSKRIYGMDKQGREVYAFDMDNGGGLQVTVLSYGVTIERLLALDRGGRVADVVMGYDSIEGYIDGSSYLGATVGRCANRIKNGRFNLNGREYTLALNDGANHLHGGPQGYSFQNWDARMIENGVVFSRLSPDGEGGYPGNLQAEVTVQLTKENGLLFCYRGIADQDTVYNPTNHCYFNLAGHDRGDAGEHSLWLNAPFFTPSGPDALPNGEIRCVVNTPMDFYTAPKPLSEYASLYPVIAQFGGYDHNYVLATGEVAAIAYDPASGRRMRVYTDMPGIQLYTANSTRGQGKGGACYEPHGAFCLETQFFPDAVNQPHFISPVLRAGMKFESRTEYRFDAE